MNIGFIGCGNMATAMIRGILSSGRALPDEIMASAKTKATLDQKRKELGIRTGTNEEVAAFSQVMFLAVKPQFLDDVIAQISPVTGTDTLVISIAAGRSLSWLEQHFDRPVRIIRAMPNTPAMVGEGMAGLSAGEGVTQEDLAVARELFGCFGRSEVVPEPMLDVVTAVSGSSPAYIFILIEAMADAAVAGGMPRADAIEFAAQAVLGSARMVLETGMHPAALKDMVCSPAGTTIEAVRVLEQKGFRSAVMEAMEACLRRSREM